MARDWPKGPWLMTIMEDEDESDDDEAEDEDDADEGDDEVKEHDDSDDGIPAVLQLLCVCERGGDSGSSP